MSDPIDPTKLGDGAYLCRCALCGRAFADDNKRATACPECRSLKPRDGASVKLISLTAPCIVLDGHTPTAEELMVYCARVSSPANQNNWRTSDRLLKYCLDHGHMSVFEQASFCVEIETTRAIAAQILRHRSFTFQEFSQRYAPVDLQDIQVPNARRSGTTNRQSSTDDLPLADQQWWTNACAAHFATSMTLYNEALLRGVAKESARFVLPLATPTRLYMNGTVRSWITYLQLRLKPDTQQEHRELALAIQAIFVEQFPITARALGWLADSSTSG